MMREPDPLAGLPAQAKKALSAAGMAGAPEAIARALQESLVTAKSKGVGSRTMHRIERWLEGKGIVRVSKDEKFFYKKSKKWLT
jgi:LDH2 family malate/lactate/ureidoglycolate dehydrogenase